jgi:murein DD-endopeptidase MepM/ murein hydrolase activator NlpD
LASVKPVLSFVALLLLAARGLADCPTPRLRLTASTREPRQGAIVGVTLRSDAPLSAAVLTGEGERIPLEAETVASPDRAGLVFRGLVGIDFEAKTGHERFELEAQDSCGGTHRADLELRVRAGGFPSQRLTLEPKYVEPPESEKERIAEDRAKVERAWASGEEGRRWRGAFALPVPGTNPGAFGARRVLNGETKSRHAGVDMAAAEGTPVLAAAPARVALAEDLYFSGGTVILDHGGGLFTTYFHLSRIDVHVGDVVAAKQPIAAVGATGRVTGPHLHWGARLHGKRVNPLGLLRLAPWPPKGPEKSDQSVKKQALSFTK